jgi:hypothetical protein
MNGDGDWNAEGWSGGDDTDLVGELRHTFIDCQRFDEHTTVRFIEAELPVPSAETVEGRLTD